MLLKRLDLFKIAFACFLIGALFHKHLPKVAPLFFEIAQGRVLAVVVVALVFFLAGEWLRNRLEKPGRALPVSAPNPNPQRFFVVGAIMALCLVGLAAFLFIQRGAPILMGDPAKAAAAKSALNIQTYGLTRITDVILPFLSILCVGLSLKHSSKKHPIVLGAMLAGLTLAILLLKAGKANVIVFLLGLMVIYDAVRPGKIRLLSKRTLLVLLACPVIAISVFYFSEGISEDRGIGFAVKYFIGRIFIYSWEGLNFIVSQNVLPDIGSQIENLFSFRSQSPSPDTLLAVAITRQENLPFAVVPTLFGFFYRNGGLVLVGSGFLVLGFLVRSVLFKMEQHKDNVLNTTAWFFVYLMLLNIFLVGNVFNEIRGMGVSILAVYLLFRFAGIVTFRKERSAPGQAP